MTAVASSVGSAPPRPRPARKRAAPERPYINRELSWLEFNGRVLEEARDPAVPLVERLKFLAIVAAVYRAGGAGETVADGRSPRADRDA